MYKTNNTAFIGKNKAIAIAFVFLFFLHGCGMWENFITYFNTFYNAQKAFEEGLEKIEESKPDKFRFKQPKLPSAAKKSFKEVIKNLSDILQHHPNSKYVDESLLILGKVFYYQGQFPKAERKFKELAAKKNSEFYLENLYWLGKTELQLRKFEKGLKTLRIAEEKANELEEYELRDAAYVAEIAFYIYRDNKEEAIKKARKLFELTDEEELKSELAYNLGKLYKELGDFENASLWFAKTLDYDPDFETEFRSKIEYAKMQRELGNYKKAKKLLLALKDEDKFNDYKDEIEVELGKVYFEMGNLSDAFYEFSLVDSVYAQQPTGGEAKFMLGNIMDKIYRNYDSAYVYYDAVRKSKADEEIKREAKKRIKTLDAYFKESIKQIKYEKQYLYATDSAAFVRDSLAYEEFLLLNASELRRIDSLQNADSTDAITERQKGQRTSEKNPELLQNLTIEERIALQKKKEREEAKKMKKPERPKIPADSLKNMLADVYLAKGNLFFSELDVPDSAEFYYRKIIDDFDTTRFDANAYYNLAAYYLTVADTAKGDSLFRIVYDEYPDNPLAEAAALKLGLTKRKIKNDPAERIYIQAENLMDKAKYDLATDVLRMIITGYPHSPYAPKAIYTLGWLYENVYDIPDSAVVYYKKLTEEFRTTEYARAVNQKMKIYEAEQKRLAQLEKAREDSIAAAVKAEMEKKAAKLLKQNADSVAVQSDSLSVKKNATKQPKKEKAQKEKRTKADSSARKPSKPVNEKPETKDNGKK